MKTLASTFLLAIALFFGSAGFPVFAETVEQMQAKSKSLNACYQSLDHKDCDLEILDPDTRLILESLHLNHRRLQGLNKKKNLTGTHEFFTDTVLEVTSEVIKLMGGSIWLLDRSYFGLPLEDVFGVMTSEKTATLYINGDEYTGELVKGITTTSSGIFSTVIKEQGDGTFLTLDNGMRLIFGSYEAYDTGYWLPPYRVLIDVRPMKMWNLKRGKKVWIQGIE